MERFLKRGSLERIFEGELLEDDGVYVDEAADDEVEYVDEVLEESMEVADEMLAESFDEGCGPSPCFISPKCCFVSRTASSC